MRIPNLLRCRKGTAALEFTLVAPALLLILFATLYFAIALNNQLILTGAAQQGAQTLSLLRGAATPFTTATSAVTKTAAGLQTPSHVTEALTVDTSPCVVDSTCKLLLDGAQGKPATVTLSYPCQLTIMGHNFGGSPCTLQARSTAIIQ